MAFHYKLWLVWFCSLFCTTPSMCAVSPPVPPHVTPDGRCQAGSAGLPSGPLHRDGGAVCQLRPRDPDTDPGGGLHEQDEAGGSPLRLPAAAATGKPQGQLQQATGGDLVIYCVSFGIQRSCYATAEPSGGETAQSGGWKPKAVRGGVSGVLAISQLIRVGSNLIGQGKPWTRT